MKSSAIAIVGMAGRFPGARNTREFWQNLRDGIESIRTVSDAELLAAGVSPEELASPEYVKRASVLDDVPMFDAGFFGFSPRDAAIMDPQHRHFLECAWEALEDAGHPPSRFSGSIGVFAGSGMNTYLIHNLLANRKLLETAGLFQLKQTGNDKDILSTRVSYQFDLRGPSLNVQTACSTSLVAVHLASQMLLNFECDMALAGGVTIENPHGRGYIYRDGEILSRDGHCRSFDASSSGTVFGSGLGVVVLRRLEDAIADHDNIHAVILGSAINNDGARKVGFLAPSVEGQASVITEALEFAGVDASDISYVETHGTGTVVGDPIEVRALTLAFGKSVSRPNSCAIGSLKTNIGHLDAAAGVSALIKTILALKHKQIPASLHFTAANPLLEIQSSPFYVNSKLADWPPGDQTSPGKPRRAGVTSLGIGGTNAHLVLEEAAPVALNRESRPYQLLTVSAKSPTAADRALNDLTSHLKAHPDLNLADAAFTTHVGRQAFAHRRALVIDSLKSTSALAELKLPSASGTAPDAPPRVVFMFSGQGSQHINMARELYDHEPVFREAIDLCAHHLHADLGLDLRDALYPTPQISAAAQSASDKLNQTWLTQPALFAVEYALAQWWISLGIEPAAMVGHSIGEFVAACLAGVFSLEDALALTAYRGRLMYALPAGSMTAVPLPPGDIYLNGTLALAAINNPTMCVVSGPTASIAALEDRLAKQSVSSRRLVTSHAFHSKMMDPILEEFEERLRSVKLSPPRLPYLSNVTGTWIQPEEATDPAYWARHLRGTVRFSDNLADLLNNPANLLIEVGPGNVLATLARQQGGAAAKAWSSLPHPNDSTSALRSALTTLGHLWTQGVSFDSSKLNNPASVQRVSLPTYPFEHQKYWIEPDKLGTAIAASTSKSASPADALSYYRRTWKLVPADSTSAPAPGPWLIFKDAYGLADQITAQIKNSKSDVVLVSPGTAYKKHNRGRYTIRPAARADYDALLADLVASNSTPSTILHLWPIAPESTPASLTNSLARCFHSPLALAQAIAAQDLSNLDLVFVSNRLQQVGDETVLDPARAVVFGPARVISKELPGIRCRTIDLDHAANAGSAALILNELASPSQHTTIAFRDGNRYVETLADLDLDSLPEAKRLTPRGVYLITGGLGGLGLALAAHLGRELNARLILVSRTSLPPESQWEAAANDSSLSQSTRDRIQHLLQIRAVCGGLLVLQADVTSVEQMRSVVAVAHTHFGKLDGVFHAAGVLEDGPLMLKTPESAARVLAPKVQGTLALEEALRGESLRCFVLFSSISSILAPAGQVDYAAANAFLDAFAQSRKGAVTVVNWGLWNDVGMGARPRSTHPWLNQLLLSTPNQVVYAGSFSEASHWQLSEHKLKGGKALIAGTSHIEMVSSAFVRATGATAFEIRDAQFLSPAMFSATESRQVRVQLRRETDPTLPKGSWRFSVFSGPSNSLVPQSLSPSSFSAPQSPGPSVPCSLEAFVEHASGSIAPAPAQSTAFAHLNLSTISARCNLREHIFDENNLRRQENEFDFGPRWRSLRRLRIGNGEALAEIELDPQFTADLNGIHFHPGLLDMATGASLYLTENYSTSTALYLPITYKTIRTWHPLPARFFSFIRPRSESSIRGEVITFDITLLDADGLILADIEGFAMRRIPEDLTRSLYERGAASDTPASGGERLIDIPAHSAIEPAEGVRALTRILQSRAPLAVVAVPQPLHLGAEPATAASSHPTPNSPAPQPQPSAENIEATLTSWWQDLLGVDQVSLDDDFFALGGHSLIGVRLFARIRKAWAVDLELALLFEARTIRRLAEVIAQLRQPAVAESRVWSALVPIQPNGSRIPLFCVHAIGGDVLFYEQLAKALGPDQPFYAFKSPLITRAHIGETSLDELASIYVSEMRAFYPQGPYLIGGASFGGNIAFEMARQLHAQGVEPALVVMFDTFVPGHERCVAPTQRAVGFFKGLRQGGLPYLSKKVSVKARYWGEHLHVHTRRLACKALSLAGMTLPLNLRYFLMDEAHRRALDRHVFEPYAGKITLMRAADRGPEVLGKVEDPTLGWAPLAAGGLEIHDIPTGHIYMLFEPFVPQFARTLESLFPQSADELRADSPAREPANLPNR